MVQYLNENKYRLTNKFEGSGLKHYAWELFSPIVHAKTTPLPMSTLNTGSVYRGETNMSTVLVHVKTTPLPMSTLKTGSVYREEINRADEHSTSSCEDYTAANVNTEHW